MGAALRATPSAGGGGAGEFTRRGGGAAGVTLTSAGGPRLWGRGGVGGAGGTGGGARGRGVLVACGLADGRVRGAGRRFFRRALGLPHTVNPPTLTVDKNPAYPRAIAEMKRDGELWRRSRLRQCKYLNNIVEQDHRRIKRLVRPGLGFGGFRTARTPLAAV